MDIVKELYSQLENTKTPEGKIDLLYQLSVELLNTDPVRSESLINEAFQLSQLHNYQTGIVEYNTGLGRLAFKKALFNEALEYFQKAYIVSKERGFTDLVAINANNMGMVYFNIGMFNNAREILLEALAIYETNGDKKALKGNTLTNIANLFNSEGEYDKALYYYLQALHIFEKKESFRMMAIVKANMAGIKCSKGEVRDGLKEYFECLDLFTKINHKNGEAETLINIARCYRIVGDSAKALEYSLKAQKMLKQLGNKKLQGYTLIELGLIYTNFAGYDKALTYLNEGLAMMQEINFMIGVCNAQMALGKLHLTMQHVDEALAHLLVCQDLVNKNGLKSEEDALMDLLQKAYELKRDLQ